MADCRYLCSLNNIRVQLKVKAYIQQNKLLSDGVKVIVGVSGGADSVDSSTAVLHGTAIPNGSSATYYFQYGTTTALGDYVLRSTGRDGTPQTAPLFGPTTEFTCDIILVNGQFVQWPEGVQR